jgi:hypothetical protein
MCMPVCKHVCGAYVIALMYCSFAAYRGAQVGTHIPD